MLSVAYPIEVASDSQFPISNTPFGIFSTKDNPSPRAGTAIGNWILNLSQIESHGLLSHSLNTDGKIHLFNQATLNHFASLPASVRSATRTRIIELLQDGGSALFSDTDLNGSAFVKQSEAVMHLPMAIGDFSDFMCSEVHVANCSRMAGAPGVPPNFYAMPIAYNGRSSSIVTSGTPIRRPRGMLRVPGTANFEFAPSRRIDYELEMGFFVSKPVPYGSTVNTADEAREHIFGFVMLNDWSARDIQFAEMTPLGPFNGKGSGTTISPWIVTLDALVGADVKGRDVVANEKMASQPAHLRHESPNETWNIDVAVALKRDGYSEPVGIAASNLSSLYWSPLQMLSHHASSGCGLRTGDLLGTGTISSPSNASCGLSSLGCLHETSEGGTKPFKLSNGDTITFVEDGDEILLTGKVIRSDGSMIGFGECTGRLENAL